MKTLLQVAGVLAWGAFVFAAVFYIGFPSKAVSQRIAYEAQERMNMAVDVQRPRPRGLSGVRFKSLKVASIPKRDNQEPRTMLSMGRTWIKIKPLAALRGLYDVKFDGVLYEGHAKGAVQYSEESVVADVDLEELEVRSFPLQGETWSIDGAGTFDAEIDLTLDQSDITKSEGDIKFEFDGLQFREGSQIYGMDAETVFDEAAGLLTVENGRATVDWARFRSDKLEAELSGYVSLKEDLLRSRLALRIKVKLLDEALDGLLALQMGDNPAHKDDKGYYHYMLSGPLDRPRPREDRAGARRAKRGRGKSSTTTPEERSERSSTRLDEMSDEEREEWEHEREERRESLREKRDARRKDLESRRSASESGSRDDSERGSTVRGREGIPMPEPGEEVEIIEEEDLDDVEFDEEDLDEEDLEEDEELLDSSGVPIDEM